MLTITAGLVPLSKRFESPVELFLSWRRKPQGKPKISSKKVALTEKMAGDHLWGAERIRGELLKDVDYHTTIHYLCSRLLRNFTDDERAQYEITDHAPTCPAQQIVVIGTWHLYDVIIIA